MNPFSNLNHRLIVILPEELADHTDLAYKVHRLAIARGCEVLYLALLGPDEDSLALMRSLVMLKAVTSSDLLAVSSKVVPQAAWLEALQEIYRPGDTLVYVAEQRVPIGFLRSLPVGEVLSDKIQAPTIELSGYYHPQSAKAKRILRAIGFWAGFLAIAAVFLLLEIQLDRGLQGAAHSLLLLITISIELGALYAWNAIFPR